MSDLLKIKISLADRVYPLTIRRDEEENIRMAAKSIEAILNKYEDGFAVRDKQDLLAMCALQLASRLEKIQTDNLVSGDEVATHLNRLSEKIKQATQ
jgi:cell division protein ZapA (FtsZ GTPase activity inhibitor)